MDFLKRHGRTILLIVMTVVVSAVVALGCVYGIFYGYYSIDPMNPTKIRVETVEFVDATVDDDGNSITGFKLTDESTGVSYLVTDQWNPIELTDATLGE